MQATENLKWHFDDEITINSTEYYFILCWFSMSSFALWYNAFGNVMYYLMFCFIWKLINNVNILSE